MAAYALGETMRKENSDRLIQLKGVALIPR